MIVITIGRGRDNDVFINEPSVSRHHCQIIQDNKRRFFILDLNSTNGTYVNGRRIRGQEPLNPLATVTVGNVPLKPSKWRHYFKPRNKRHKSFIIVLIAVALIAAIVLSVVLASNNENTDSKTGNRSQQRSHTEKTVTTESNNTVKPKIRKADDGKNLEYQPVEPYREGGSNVPDHNGWIFFKSVKSWTEATVSATLYIYYREGNGIREYYSGPREHGVCDEYDPIRMNPLYQSDACDDWRRDYYWITGPSHHLYYFNSELPSFHESDNKQVLSI